MVVSLFRLHPLPDVCPTTLAVLARVRDNIARNAAGAEDIQFVFVS